MEVSEAYLAKIRRAVRIKTITADGDAELTDIINECRTDLESLGVRAAKTQDEADAIILGAVRCFARWKMAADEYEANANREDYMLMRDELRRKSAYAIERGPAYEDD